MAGKIDLENMKLSDLFDYGWKMEQELEKLQDEKNDEFLIKRKKAIEIMRKCKLMLDELHLFSDNESLEEVSSSEIRYFLNEALLGWLLSKINSTEPNVRIAALEESKTYFLNFLHLTKYYKLHSFNLDKLENGNSFNDQLDQTCVNMTNKQAVFDMNLLNQAYERNEKIKRFKEQKELESQLKLLQSSNLENIDEEHKRKFFVSYVKFWINKSIDDLKLVIDEIKILKSIDLEKHNRAENHQKHSTKTSNQSQKPIHKPFIITRDLVQSKVFGIGYPSVPVYSIEQFYDHLADEGYMPKSEAKEENYAPVKIGGGVTNKQKEQEKIQQDLLEDNNDEVHLQRQRNWDEFKDDNKRGAGNRINRS